MAPARCMACLREGTWLCSSCQPTLAVNAPFPCLGCGKPQPRGRICARCQPDYTLHGVVSIGAYSTPWLKRGIHWLKFKGVRPVAGPLARFMVPRLTLIDSLDRLRTTAILIPLPLHTRRQRTRGFNQSEDLALHLSRASGIPVLPLLKRSRATMSQANIPVDLRTENMQEAFSLANAAAVPANTMTAIIIDDVVTTGASLEAAAKALTPLPLHSIWGLTVARG